MVPLPYAERGATCAYIRVTELELEGQVPTETAPLDGAHTNGSVPANLTVPGDAVDPWKVYDLAELRALGFTFSWLVKGWWVVGAYGMLAGAEKSLKTWIAAFETVSIASGLPLFGRFDVKTPGPVTVFTGEGYAPLFWSRLKHIAHAYGLTDEQFDALPIRVCDVVGKLTGDGFQATLRAEIENYKPVLIIIDPLYTYVGAGTEAGSVFDMGEILSAASNVTSKAGVALKIGHHMRKSATEHPTLQDITQAGSREWVGSWQLISHRGPPDLASQEFHLRLTIGARYGYGSVWDLDVNLGPLNEDTLEHEGEATWELKPASETAAEDKQDKHEESLAADRLVLSGMGSTTIKQFAAAIGKSDETARRRLDGLVTSGMALVDKSGKASVYTTATP